MKDFFISYNQADREWAEWIAYTLENAQFTTVIQAWDFRPGRNFVEEMHVALQTCTRTIAVLSVNYVSSVFTLQEWTAAFANGSLTPVRVGEYEPVGVLKTLIYCDLVNTDEATAKERLLLMARGERVKPTGPVAFPNQNAQMFPGTPEQPVMVEASEQKRAAKQLLDLLNTTYTTFIAQSRLRDDLTGRLESRLGIHEQYEYEELFDRFFNEMTPDERRLHRTIRAYTENVLSEYNALALKLLQSFPDLEREVPLVRELKQHLIIWLSKFQGLFKTTLSMCLVYVGVEEKVPFPEGVEKNLRDYLDSPLEDGKLNTHGRTAKSLENSATMPRTGMTSAELKRLTEEVREESGEGISRFLKEGVFLLFLDRYSEGVWGRSLATTAETFGHKNDAGSITVTYWALKALRSLFPFEHLEEIEAFRGFLVARQKEKGAVGLWKEVGPAFAPSSIWIGHARHTAVAAKFFEENHAVDRALECLKFLIANQHPGTGGWAAIPTQDAEPDPITTAYVLRTLLDFEKKKLFTMFQQKGLDTFAATFWTRGVRWLQENLVENGYWWLYKTSKDNTLARAYGFSADVLNILPELIGEDSPMLPEYHTKLMENLARAWRNNGYGLPVGVDEKKADLDPTSQFVLTCWGLRDRYSNLLAEFLPHFYSRLEKLENISSNAAGWSLAIALTCEVFPEIRPPREVLELGRQDASNLWKRFQPGCPESALDTIKGKPVWVQRAVETILRVTMKPV